MSDVYGHAEAIGQVQTEEGKTFIFNGATYDCIAGDVKDTKTLGFGGFLPNADKVIVAQSEQFNGVPPAYNDTITIDERDVFVAAVTTSPDGAFIVIECTLVRGI